MGAFGKGVALWTGGVIPYESNLQHPFWKLILKAINEINKRTIVKLLPKSAEQKTHFIRFTSEPRGNFATMGKQQISIVNIDKNVRALHELVHTIGLIHEHQRHDRDKHITVHQQFLADSAFTRSQIIDILPSESETEYDVKSCMHYWATVGRKEGLSDKILTLTNNKQQCKKLKTAEKLSALDIQCINSKYSQFSFLDRYPVNEVDVIYDINRENQNIFKKFIAPNQNRSAQLFRLQLLLENKKASRRHFIVTLNSIIQDIDKETHFLGKSTLRSICVDLLQWW